MREYTTKTVYVGIDVHKKSYSVTAVCDRQLIKKDRLLADPRLLVEYCKGKFKGAIVSSAYEAGFCGYSLHRVLVDSGINNRIVHPAGIEVAVSERVKNDRRDYEKIAAQLAEGSLMGIHVPTVKRERLTKVKIDNAKTIFLIPFQDGFSTLMPFCYMFFPTLATWIIFFHRELLLFCEKHGTMKI